MLSVVPTLVHGMEGYYRWPALHDDTIVFSAEGDLWAVSASGGAARRLTTHPGEERYPKISPDGKIVAFTASYEGPAEVYTMPLVGGLPQRWTYESDDSIATGWTPNNELVYTTTHFSTLPDRQLVSIDLESNRTRRIPLSQASEASFDASGKTVFFVRPPDHRNVTKRYSGGTARQIWSFTEGGPEAVRLTIDHRGESHHPMWLNGRVYYVTDRDGVMNIWSMREDGSDLQQHTEHLDFDVRQPYQQGGRIVYHRAGDLWLFDINTGENRVVPITLVSDLDQLREKWVTDPAKYITHVDFHPEGTQLVLTARGRVFVVPVKGGRRVALSRKPGVRYRDAVFSADGNSVIPLSDASSEYEFERYPANGIGAGEVLTSNGNVLRFAAQVSPDGKWLAYSDLKNDLWLLNTESGDEEKVSTNNNGIGSVAWSPDSQWLAFEQTASNTFSQIHLYSLTEKTATALTTDRANSYRPVWHPKGELIYFLSDRNFDTLVGSPWGTRQPEPYFDRKMKIYHVALRKGLRSPFRVADELMDQSESDAGSSPDRENSPADSEAEGESEEKENRPKKNGTAQVIVELDGIQRRIQEVPVPPGNYGRLQGNDGALFFTQRETGVGAKTHLMALAISNESPKAVQVTSGIRSFDVSRNGKKMLIRKGTSFYVVNAVPKKVGDLDDGRVDLSNWSFPIDVREDWRQIFTDAWRMERDYFYDPNMHGVDWDGMHQKYLPFVDRVTTRDELSDVIGRLVGELSALHTSVRGGDLREGPEDVGVASLGARFSRNAESGGYQIEYIYRADPDYPNERSPLDHPELDIEVGDVITQINGVETLSVRAIGELLRNQAGKQVRLRILKKSGDGLDAIVEPLARERALRYDDWEYSRRLRVEEESEGKVGYVHLQAMGSSDLEQWYREFYPVFDRPGLVVDVRHNRGGNIESFILEKLMRTAWMYWKTRDLPPDWNMQYAFRGHIIVLCDALTASDGEAFCEGFRRLGLGKVLGIRTWGGEIWLNSSNTLSDNGIARAPMSGVFGPEGKWLVEQIGVIPDIEVDNLPHATFNGKDAQLRAAIEYLLAQIEEDSRAVPTPPAFPNLSFEARPDEFRKQTADR